MHEFVVTVTDCTSRSKQVHKISAGTALDAAIAAIERYAKPDQACGISVKKIEQKQ